MAQSRFKAVRRGLSQAAGYAALRFICGTRVYPAGFRRLNLLAVDARRLRMVHVAQSTVSSLQCQRQAFYVQTPVAISVTVFAEISQNSMNSLAPCGYAFV